MLTYQADAGHHSYDEFTSDFSPSGNERFKLDRLRELRAVIESLRAERDETRDPVAHLASDGRGHG